MQDMIISSEGQQSGLGKKETLKIIQHTDPVSSKTAETAVMKCSSCTKYVKFMTSTPTSHPIFTVHLLILDNRAQFCQVLICLILKDCDVYLL